MIGRRPLIEMPQWDGKTGLAAIFVIGYFLIIYLLVRRPLEPVQKEIAVIALAALGPQLGQIFGSIYRTTLSDERASARRSVELREAITAPSPAADPSKLGDAVESGARAGTRQGVGDAMSGDESQ